MIWPLVSFIIFAEKSMQPGMRHDSYLRLFLQSGHTCCFWGIMIPINSTDAFTIVFEALYGIIRSNKQAHVHRSFYPMLRVRGVGHRHTIPLLLCPSIPKKLFSLLSFAIFAWHLDWHNPLMWRHWDLAHPVFVLRSVDIGITALTCRSTSSFLANLNSRVHIRDCLCLI